MHRNKMLYRCSIIILVVILLLLASCGGQSSAPPAEATAMQPAVSAATNEPPPATPTPAPTSTPMPAPTTPAPTDTPSPPTDIPTPEAPMSNLNAERAEAFEDDFRNGLLKSLRSIFSSGIPSDEEAAEGIAASANFLAPYTQAALAISDKPERYDKLKGEEVFKPIFDTADKLGPEQLEKTYEELGLIGDNPARWLRMSHESLFTFKSAGQLLLTVQFYEDEAKMEKPDLITILGPDGAKIPIVSAEIESGCSGCPSSLLLETEQPIPAQSLIILGVDEAGNPAITDSEGNPVLQVIWVLKADYAAN
jgi:hypothetical protein